MAVRELRFESDRGMSALRGHMELPGYAGTVWGYAVPGGDADGTLAFSLDFPGLGLFGVAGEEVRREGPGLWTRSPYGAGGFLLGDASPEPTPEMTADFEAIWEFVVTSR